MRIRELLALAVFLTFTACSTKNSYVFRKIEALNLNAQNTQTEKNPFSALRLPASNVDSITNQNTDLASENTHADNYGAVIYDVNVNSFGSLIQNGYEVSPKTIDPKGRCEDSKDPLLVAPQMLAEVFQKHLFSLQQSFQQHSESFLGLEVKVAAKQMPADIFVYVCGNTEGQLFSQSGRFFALNSQNIVVFEGETKNNILKSLEVYRNGFLLEEWQFSEGFLTEKRTYTVGIRLPSSVDKFPAERRLSFNGSVASTFLQSHYSQVALYEVKK